MSSKLIKYPEFTPLPKTDAANVIENIQRWIEKGNESRLTTFCRLDNSELGYRFVNDNDFLEKIEEEHTLLRRKVKIVFTRYAESRDHIWPLYFSVRKITAEIHYNGQVHQYKNDNQLRKFIKFYS